MTVYAAGRSMLSGYVALSVLAIAVLTPNFASAQDPKPKKTRTAKPRPKPVLKKAAPAPEEKSSADEADDAPEEEADETDDAPREEGDETTAEGETPNADEDAPSVVATAVAKRTRQVIAIRNNRVVLDITDQDGFSEGDLIPLYRTIEITHPATGDTMADTIRVGKLELVHIGSALSLATVSGGELEDFEVGDSMQLALAARPTQGTATEKLEHAADVHAAMVYEMVGRLRGASIRKRVVTYEAYVERYPKSRYAVTLWEEAQTLRELIPLRVQKRMAMAPARPLGAVTLDTVGKAKPDNADNDFAEAERRHRQLMLRLKRDGKVAEASLDDDAPPEDHYRHDGGFLRLSFGPAWFNGNLEGNFRQSQQSPNVAADVPLTGFGFTGEFLGGGAPVPGFILAARVAITMAPEPSASFSDLDETFSDAELNIVAMPTVGALVDIYPDPELGVHFFGHVGFTSADLHGDDRVGDPASFFGLAYGGGIGVEGFMSEQWSVGVQARIDAAWMGSTTGGSENEDVLTIVSPALQLAFTYN